VRVLRLIAPIVLVAAALGCKSAATPAPVTPPPAPPPPPVVSLDKKVAWLLRLEQQRVLSDLAPGESPAPAASTTAPRALVPAYTADLVALSLDPDPAIRRRAALAIGRVGMPEGVPVLASALSDPEDDVRASAAFALGLLGDKRGIAPLQAALRDESPLVRGRAAEGLGLIGDGSAAAAVAEASAGCRAELAPIEPDDESPLQSPAVEACRLALYALVRLRSYEALARVALDDQGQPVSRWWPVAYALQRIGDARSTPALLTLATGPGTYSVAFALRGLAAAKDARALPPALAAAKRADADVRLRVAAVRALADVGGAEAVPVLLSLAGDAGTPPNLALEAVTALGALRDRRAFSPLLNLLTDPWPAMRSAALAATARIDAEGFVLMLSSLERDRDWSVRASLATILGTLPAETARPAILELVADPDVRVHGSAIEALARVGAPDLGKRLFEALEAPDVHLRATAARLMGEQKIEGGAARLAAAYSRAETDPSYVARAAVIDALVKYGADAARETVTRALADRDWPVRLRAAELLRDLGQPAAAPDRPAPIRQPADVFESDRMLHPKFSPQAYLETRHGTIQVDLNVVDAPFTTWSFIELARAGFFTGVRVHRLVPNFVIQAGDPRGDGEGGPGYTIRDELSPLPFLRGTVGLALAGRDTGGSQFFITVSPQPHLDARYTVFGRVVNGFDILDKVSQWDVIERVRIWDGVTLQ
jgi:HEAT repeat protein/cyclophilin family peptidyl-prolyl cis-trans isomerase